MDLSEVKAYLSRYYRLDKEITNKINILERIKKQALSVSGGLNSNTGVRTTASGDRIGSVVAKICDLEAEINREIDKATDIMQDIKTLIDSMPENTKKLWTLKQLLKCRYLECLSFEDIAERLDMSCYHIVHRLHPKALEEVKKILESR